MATKAARDDHIESDRTRKALRDFLAMARECISKDAVLIYNPSSRGYALEYMSEIPLEPSTAPRETPTQIPELTATSMVRMKPHTITREALVCDESGMVADFDVSSLCHQETRLKPLLEKYLDACKRFIGDDANVKIVVKDGKYYSKIGRRVHIHERSDGLTFASLFVLRSPRLWIPVSDDALEPWDDSVSTNPRPTKRARTQAE